MRVIRTIALFVVVSVSCGLPAFAQATTGYWPKPASTPGVDVKCVGCVGTKRDLLTPGYPTTITKFVGRFLDSQATEDYQQPFRTARAFHVVPALSRGRIYMIVGSAAFAYDINTFFTRITQNEDLMDANAVSVTGPYASNKHPYPTDKFLRYDNFFYAENEPSNWVTPQVDGQERLFGIDYDDQGYVYLAYHVYGWGIVKDDGTDSGALMQSSFQYTGSLADDVDPFVIVSLKGSTGHYYALISGGGTVTNVFDVTDRTNPGRMQSLSLAMRAYAKTSDNGRIGMTTPDGKFQIYTTDALVAHGAPMFQIAGSMTGVACDGTNFYTTTDTPSGMVISVFGPSGSSYTKLADYTTASYGSSISTLGLRYNDGYLTWAGSTNGTSNLRVFKLQNAAPVEIDFSLGSSQYEPKRSYFKYYYISALDSAHTFPYKSFFYDSVVVKRTNHTYLVVTSYSLGDIYELPSTDSVAVTNLGPSGSPNLKSGAAAGAGPFYGDPIAFKATTGAPNGMSIQWDFGNPEAPAAADPNFIPMSQTGVTVSHRYSGVTNPATLPITRTVKVQNTGDSSINSTVSVTLQKPVVRFGVGNYKYLFLQPDASSPAPIVLGDSFFDGSDGTVESHYNTWSIDGGTALTTMPPGAVDVGLCGQHTLSFDAHYGQYSTSPIATLGGGPGMPIGVHGTGFDFVYAVRPFAAAIDVTSDAINGLVIFKSLTRVSSTALSNTQAAALMYRWELLNASNAVIGTPVTGPAPLGVIPDFQVLKTALAGLSRVRAHLVVTSPNGAGTGCTSFTSAEAFTSPLSAPDVSITGGCTNGGPPCVFNAVPGVGVDPVADGWTYSWSISSTSGGMASFSSNTGSTFSPVFTQATTYQVNLIVQNALASTTKSVTQVVTTVGTTCDLMTAGQNVFIAYHNASNSCTQSYGTCGVGDTISFSAASFGYNYDCATHTYTWSFGDGQGGSGKNPTHAYNAGSTYAVTLTITNPGQTITLSQAVAVGGATPPTPVPPTPVPPTPVPPAGGCGTMTAGVTVFPHFVGPSSGCTDISGNCNANESIAFSAQAFGYDFSCAAHTFTWNFGDNTQYGSGRNTTHAYAGAGTYPISLTIGNGQQTVTTTTTVHVGSGGSTPTPVTPTPTPPTGSCQPIQNGLTFFVDYLGPSSQCTQYQGNCNTTEILTFTLKAFNYDFGCATHTIQWDFGDNSPTGSGISTTHRYLAAGSYSLKATVVVNGQAYPVSQTVKVSGQSGVSPPPTTGYAFDFTATPLLNVPNAYTFTAFPVGNTAAANVTYTWDFGDGHTDTTTSASTMHIYADAKVYTVTLSVSGYSGSAQHPVVSRRRPAHH